MDLPKIRTVVSDPSQPDGDRLVLLRMADKGMHEILGLRKITRRLTVYDKPADIPAEAQQFLDKEAKGLQEYKVDLDYDYWTAGALFLGC
jgi:tRNA (guanine37-N1)-methyltransferase